MATVDLTFANLRTLFGTFRYFSHGWGRPYNHHATWLHQVRTHTLPRPDLSLTPLTITPYLSNPSFSFITFPSPAASFLPPASATARALYVTPVCGDVTVDASSAFRPAPPLPPFDTLVPLPRARRPPLALLLPATGDHGFARRLFTHAFRLRAHGVASLILESPFYGCRRPGGQIGALLRHVHELPDLGRATIEEAIVLLSHFHAAGYTRQVTTGLSQGGLHAAMIASVLPWDVNFVAAFAPHSAAPVFTQGVLANMVDWGALGHGAKHRLSHVLDVSHIGNFPCVARDRDVREVLLSAREDRYVLSDCVDAWKVARPNLQVRWVPGGHVTGAVLRFPCITQAILDVLSADEC